ncbi:5',5'''-P-1,P-4-tetraphosphate phosphorylase, putative [Paecilomyces variotii No. 5]|uniref:5',5'''-P-1,P-4-tetraphosphate phosphorylase, putative n=1 Tax=Byssochlamys spectabilis (strain No. 5 / NBRC 109023) TaxID=1356009 RepID=V5FPT7_BYSSN|nr:5',5'''-P-1,P-4-tetraphosphate phosphorylase, putative [Paecilomyces variotii No. 5]
MPSTRISENGADEEDFQHLGLPADLEAKTYAKFDSMVRERRIFYDVAKAELYSHNGFLFEFRIIPTLSRKPVLAPKDPGRIKASGPFINPNPDEVITDIGQSYRLLLNKYCVYRPMLVLPTREFALQEDDLNATDLTAVWAVMKSFSTPLLMIYNCGVNSGSSQGHKHLQLFAAPEHELWPARATSEEDVASRIPGVSFKHYVLRIPEHATTRDVVRIHERLLALTKEALVKAGDVDGDYNVAMTAEWMALIPRRTFGPGGPNGSNAAGMLGLVAIKDDEERERWAELGYTDYLAYLGVPVDA